MTGNASAQAAEAIAAQYFDGVSAQPSSADVRVMGDELCAWIDGGRTLRMPLRDVQWPERQRHGARVVHLPDGGALHFGDPLAFDHWSRRSRVGESWVVKAQQSWRWTAAGALALVLLCGGLYAWGLPVGARAALAFVPTSVDAELGEMAMRSIRDEGWLKPSELPAARQQQLRAAWTRAAANAPAGTAPIVLHFHKSKMGPNAFALPGGHVVLTDEMVDLVGGDEQIIIGVLAHEASHVSRRHGMRMLAQTTLLGSVTAIAFGDFSGVLATAPAMLGHLGYSRDFEREADTDAIALLQANAISPAVMATMFERLKAHQKEEGVPELPIALGSHPPDDERIARFREAAAKH
ncbi:M48 family metallopeptidase [Rhizobacter sp. LjRoot28]|uniref:M48 family metallopeptidase n=1 Tax=Rhizobacter sp. LjRoot28 TaxID=3342309 RepID=UPI003ECCA14B